MLRLHHTQTDTQTYLVRNECSDCPQRDYLLLLCISPRLLLSHFHEPDLQDHPRTLLPPAPIIISLTNEVVAMAILYVVTGVSESEHAYSVD